VKGNAAALHTLPGIEIGDKIVGVSRIRAAFGTAGGWGSMATLTASQFSVSAANRITKKGNPVTFTGMVLLVNWVDKNASTLA
jgi:hypothetical protein